MKKAAFPINFIIFALILFCPGCGKKAPTDYPVKPVPFTAVQFQDNFWLPRMETNRSVTIPYAFEQSRETGRIKNFEIAAGMVQVALQQNPELAFSDFALLLPHDALGIEYRSIVADQLESFVNRYSAPLAHTHPASHPVFQRKFAL